MPLVADKTVYTMTQSAELPCFNVRVQWRFHRGEIGGRIAAQVDRKATSRPVAQHMAVSPKGARR